MVIPFEEIQRFKSEFLSLEAARSREKHMPVMFRELRVLGIRPVQQFDGVGATFFKRNDTPSSFSSMSDDVTILSVSSLSWQAVLLELESRCGRSVCDWIEMSSASSQGRRLREWAIWRLKQRPL